MMNNSDIYLFSSLLFSVCYEFKSRSHMQRSSFICSHFSFIAPVEGLCCKPKYRANIIHHVIFVFYIYIFSIILPAVRIMQLSVLSLKFGNQDFTDPGLLTGGPSLVCRYFLV